MLRFFDKYNSSSINSITSTTTINSISITINATAGDNPILKYYVSINDSNWVEVTLNSYVFSDLSSNTSYKIKVKCVDSLGKYSDEFSENITTSSYVNPSITNVTTSTTSNSIIVTVTGKNGSNSITKYYYSKDNGSSYVSSSSNSYTFSGLSTGSYNIKVYVQDSNGKNSGTVSRTVSITAQTLIDYIKSKYTGTQGTNGIYYHSSSLSNGAGDNSYRYAGANPNNYVCFGSDASTCPNENLYRIIGIINGKVKLILADGATTNILGTNGGYSNTYSGADYSSNYKGSGSLSEIGVYYYNENQTNTWSDSTTNTVNLNTNFLNYLDGKNTKWKKMIDDTIWYIGGFTYANGVSTNAKTAYNYEVGANKDTSSTVTAKIGIMYASDYYYGATSSYWTYSGEDYSNAYNYNWMSIGLYEWAISPFSDYSNRMFYVFHDGSTDWGGRSDDGVIRPCFNLTSSVTYSSGSGSKTSPIRLS